MNSTLYLLRLPLRLDRLWQLAGERNWLSQKRGGRDDGLALHHSLNEVFGAGILKPFRLMVSPGHRVGFIYSYCRQEPGILRENTRFCGPEYDRLFDMEQLQLKPMMTDFSPGRQLGFDIRIRPVRRSKRGVAGTGDKEIDAFLHEARHKFPEVGTKDYAADGVNTMAKTGRSREAVYRDWFQERLGDAAEISTDFPAKLVRFQRSPAIRNGRTVDGPDAILQGNLQVRDSNLFADLLVKGIGRHKAYGYGMLLLRPPGTMSC